MARGRIISATLGESRKYAALTSEVARVAYVLIVANTDKAGRLEADPFYITRKVCTRLPYTSDQLAEALDDMERVGLIIRYMHEDVPVLQVVDFDKHNTPHYKEPESKYRDPANDGNTVTDAKPQRQAKHDSNLSQARPEHAPVVADNRSKENGIKEKGSEAPSSEDRFARAFETGKPQANEQHRVRSEIRHLAGNDFARKHENDLASWARWSNEQLRERWEASDPLKWPQEGHKQRAWIYADLLNEKRQLRARVEPESFEGYGRSVTERLKREMGLN